MDQIWTFAGDRLTREDALAEVLGSSASKFAPRDLHTVGDLLDFLPRRYIDAATSGRLADFALDEPVVLVATVVSSTTRTMRARRGRMLEAVIADADGEHATLVFFKPFGHEQRLQPGRRALFRGTLKAYRSTRQLSHPDYTILDGDEEDLYEGLVPIYKDLKGLSDMQVTMAMRYVLDHLDLGEDPVPEALRDKHHLLSQAQAYRGLHLPTEMAQVGRARRRLRYDEALVVQTVLAQRRARFDAEQAVPRTPVADGLLAAFDAQLPFELTAGQVQVGAEISADLAASRPMHRLLQGEVGSGKTIVALRAMLATVDAGAQAALLAPTEVLAQQHAASIRTMLGPLAEGGMLGGAETGTQVALLTGSMTRGQREKVLLDILTGPVGIVVGTHALIQDQVRFADLGLVVVDEQHRFGVEQRDALRDKAARPPHLLVMTATPIPRTVAMTVFGDMDTSTLGELPGGRRPIESFVVPGDRADWMDRTWKRVAEEVSRGHQAYVVCPRIGDDDTEQADGIELWDLDGDVEPPPEEETGPPAQRQPAGVVATVEELREMPALAGLRIEMMHGKLPSEEKDAVMADYAAGEIDVLVSTTVIEVGVDVPNATAMVILDADRFGISQLHQLRGRVGRGSAGGLCLLVTHSQNEETVQRLTSVAATTDGFALADLDLELRREGDVLGSSQSGRRTQLRLLRLTHQADVDLIVAAREDITPLVAADPELKQAPLLARMVAERVDDEQAAFLERG
ncbi:ATP-dependent DNA helicase RecG [Dermacoccaceae bacterium W4C1]